MVRFRTLELYPHGYPQTAEQMVADPRGVNHLHRVFKQSMLAKDNFRSQGISNGQKAHVFASFQRIDQTAGMGIWTRYQTDCPFDEMIRRGFDAFTLMLSGVSEVADRRVIDKFDELVKAPTLTTPQFTTQDYGIAPQFVDKIRDEKPPVGLNIYLRPNVVEQTVITTAAAAMVAAFFDLLGAEYAGR